MLCSDALSLDSHEWGLPDGVDTLRELQIFLSLDSLEFGLFEGVDTLREVQIAFSVELAWLRLKTTFVGRRARSGGWESRSSSSETISK